VIYYEGDDYEFDLDDPDRCKDPRARRRGRDC
jgi:hypothetical protein